MLCFCCNVKSTLLVITGTWDCKGLGLLSSTKWNHDRFRWEEFVMFVVKEVQTEEFTDEPIRSLLSEINDSQVITAHRNTYKKMLEDCILWSWKTWVCFNKQPDCCRDELTFKFNFHFFFHFSHTHFLFFPCCPATTLQFAERDFRWSCSNWWNEVYKS